MYKDDKYDAQRDEVRAAELRILASGAKALDAFTKRLQTAERLDSLRVEFIEKYLPRWLTILEAYLASMLAKDPPSNL